MLSHISQLTGVMMTGAMMAQYFSMKKYSLNKQQMSFVNQLALILGPESFLKS